MGYLHDYRGGSVFKTTRIQYENFILENGGTRIITVRYADGGQAGDDLIVKAGDNDDNLDGGDLYLRGGGTIEGIWRCLYWEFFIPRDKFKPNLYFGHFDYGRK